MDDPIEEQFRERLQHHEEAPPAHAWPRIRKEIAPSPRQRPAFGWRLFAALLLLGLASVMLTVRLLPGRQAASPTAATTASEAAAQSPQTGPEAATAQQSASTAPGQTASATQPPTAEPANRQPSAQHGTPAGTTAQAPETRPPGGSTYALAPSRQAAASGIRLPSVAAIAATPEQPEQAANLPEKPARQKLAATHAPGITLRGATGQPMGRRAARHPKHQAGSTPAEPPQPNSREADAASRQAQPAEIPAAKPEPEALPIAAAPAHAPLTGTQASPIQTTAPAIGPATDSALAAALTQTEPDALRQAASADSAAPDSKPDSRLSYGFYTGARYRIRRFAPNPTDNLYISNLTDNNASHPTRFDYELGAAGQWQLSNKLAAEVALGALYVAEQVAYTATSGQQTSPTITQAGNQLHLQPNYLYNSHRTQTRALYSNVRTGLVYTVGKAPAGRLQLSGGGQASVLTWHKSEAFINGAPSGTAGPGLSRLQTGAYAGVRLTRSLSKELDLAVEPSAGYYFNSRYGQASPFRISNHTYNLNLLFFLK